MNRDVYKNYFQGCKLILEHYGLKKQKQQLIQELGELIVAITKNNLENILEEMADCLVMIDQFLTIDEYFDRVEVIKLEKLKRQLERIKKENQGRGKNE